MNQERELDFYLVPKSVLVEEMMQDLIGAYTANVPVIEDIPEALRPALLDSILRNQEQLRLNAELSVRERYRLPNDIPENEIVEKEERDRITSIIKDADAFALDVTQGIKVDYRGKQFPPGYISFRWEHPIPEARWFGMPLAGRLTPNARRNRPTHHLISLAAFLDAAENLDDYCNPGKGADMFSLARDETGNIKSYWVKYKGSSLSPRTPWDYMHKDDLPIIQDFVGRAQKYIQEARNGSLQYELSV